MKVISFDRAAAVNYARRWALGRNPAYYDFENVGGDCTNFASQCLFAGAKIMNYKPILGWYYNSSSDRTPSWSGVEYLYNFLINNKSIGPFGHTVAESDAERGDIIQLGANDRGFYHSPVITAVSPFIQVAAHTFDALDRPLFTYNYETIRFIHIDGVRIW